MSNINKVKELLKQMTLREKIAQMYQTTPGSFSKSANSEIECSGPVTGPEQGNILSKEILYSIGSILNADNAKTAYEIQKEYLESSRLEIPLLFMFDIIHGFRTIFPIPLGLACSWDTSLIEKTARVAAKEGAASGINVTFAPMADLSRDARWGRVMESVGEDPLLNEKLTAAYVRGFQGEDLSSEDTLASCVKHFAAYGAVEAGREYNTVDMSEYTLRNHYLSGYQGGIEAGAAMMMSSFTSFNGMPATGDKLLLRQLLRGELGFEGVVISDYASVAEIKVHNVAKDGAEAALKAIEAGLDIEMDTVEYISRLEGLVLDGLVDEELIDEAARRILTLKYNLGLFDDPFHYIKAGREKKYHLCPEHRQLSRKAASESMVLLKNDDILPFSKDVKSLAVIGPFADNKEILGEWVALGKAEEAVTLKEGIINKLGEEVKVIISKGCGSEAGGEVDFDSAIKTAKDAEIVILALGEPHTMIGEGRSRAYLNVAKEQQELAEKILELNKPTAMVLFNGRPLELEWFDKNVPAILEAWFPGTEGGNAVADILFGDVNPSGKLTMSFPYTVGQMPLYYNHLNTGRPIYEDNKDFRFSSRYIDVPNEPLYPFGYGLSYSDFKYSNPSIDKVKMTAKDVIKVSIDIKNEGQYIGEEIVQFYIRDLAASVSRPVLELKDYKKISLGSGEKSRVEFEITKDTLAFYNPANEYVVEPGYFKLFIGSDSATLTECGELYFDFN